MSYLISIKQWNNGIVWNFGNNSTAMYRLNLGALEDAVMTQEKVTMAKMKAKAIKKDKEHCKRYCGNRIHRTSNWLWENGKAGYVSQDSDLVSCVDSGTIHQDKGYERKNTFSERWEKWRKLILECAELYYTFVTFGMVEQNKTVVKKTYCQRRWL